MYIYVDMRKRKAMIEKQKERRNGRMGRNSKFPYGLELDKLKLPEAGPKVWPSIERFKNMSIMEQNETVVEMAKIDTKAAAFLASLMKKGDNSGS